MSLKEKLKEKFEGVNPKTKGRLIKAVVFAAILILVILYVQTRETTKAEKKVNKNPEVDLAFDKTHLEEAWYAQATKKEHEWEKRLQTIESHLKLMPREIEDQRKDFKKEYEMSMQRLTDEKDNILGELEKIRTQVNDGKLNKNEGEERIKALLREQELLFKREQAVQAQQALKEKKTPEVVKSAYPQGPVTPPSPSQPPESQSSDPSAGTTGQGPKLGVIPEKNTAGSKQESSKSSSHANLIHMEIDSPKTSPPGQEAGKKKDSAKVIPIEYVIPVGSFFKVTLLSGIDAATGLKAQGQPQPVLLKINDLSQLPNKFKQDVRQCHIIAEAFGSLGDERAYLRTSTLSCIKKDGGLINSKMEGWVTGEDGTLGLRGKVVSKKGAFLARRIVASFLEGVAAAFASSNRRVDSWYGGATTTTVSPADAFKNGIGQGAADAMRDLAKSYEKMSEDIMVVIEIASGRKGHVVISTETSLEVKKKLPSV